MMAPWYCFWGHSLDGRLGGEVVMGGVRACVVEGGLKVDGRWVHFFLVHHTRSHVTYVT